MIRLLLLLLLSCSEDVITNESIPWVENLIVSRTLDESINELYLQVELSEKINISDINSVSINLEYVGSGDLEYNESFILYDDGTHGDLIENNGVYTLIDLADKLIIPNDDLEIVSIEFPNYIEVHPNNSVTVAYSVLVKGKKYLSTVNISTKTDIIKYSEYINLDNTKIAIEKNNAGLYYDLNPSDDECAWELSPNPPLEDEFVPLTIGDENDTPYILPEAQLSGSEYFIYQDSLSVSPISRLDPATNICIVQGTGTLVWRFKLISKENENSEIYKDKTFILYGCGDGICTQYYENNASCLADCANE